MRRAGQNPESLMPHLTIECSSGLRDLIDCADFLAFAHGKVASLGVFRPVALRSRLCAGEEWLVGDGTKVAEAAHIKLQAKKRPDEVKAAVLKELYDAAQAYLEDKLAGTGSECMLSVEVLDFDEFYLS